MRIKEYIQKYCTDLKPDNRHDPDPLDSEYFSYDYEVYDDSTGKMEKAVYEGGQEILVRHIIECLPEDFEKIYPNQECIDIYFKYLKSFKIMYGEDVLMQAQKDIQTFKSKLAVAKDFEITGIHGGIDASSFSVHQG